jgi:hypothetical protein
MVIILVHIWLELYEFRIYLSLITTSGLEIGP